MFKVNQYYETIDGKTVRLVPMVTDIFTQLGEVQENIAGYDLYVRSTDVFGNEYFRFTRWITHTEFLARGLVVNKVNLGDNNE
jgi:hypothetical protein